MPEIRLGAARVDAGEPLGQQPIAAATIVLAQLAYLAIAYAPRLKAKGDATSPIDYTQRNQPYTPADSVRGEKKKPATNGSVQEKRVEKTMVEKQKSSLREREAAVDVKEARPKQVREKESYPTEVVEHKTSDFNHQASAYSTASGTSKPPMVARYQDSLTAANAIKVKTTSALSRATAATYCPQPGRGGSR